MEDIEIFPSTIDVKPKKKRKSKFKSFDERREKAERKGFTPMEVEIVKVNCAMPHASLVEKGKAAGLVGKDSVIGQQVSRTLKRVEEKTSCNLRFQELLRLKGAGVEKMAEVVADALNAETPFRGRETVLEGDRLVTKDVTKMFPDHRARMDAARFAAEAQQAMPDKKVVIEEFKYEEKIQVIAEIKNDPRILEGLQRLLEEKKRMEGGG